MRQTVNQKYFIPVVVPVSFEILKCVFIIVSFGGGIIFWIILEFLFQTKSFFFFFFKVLILNVDFLFFFCFDL